jgi:hypothetical protein
MYLDVYFYGILLPIDCLHICAHTEKVFLNLVTFLSLLTNTCDLIVLHVTKKTVGDRVGDSRSDWRVSVGPRSGDFVCALGGDQMASFSCQAGSGLERRDSV